jgi:RNA polymerase sigma-70 factor, ECF subfamily
MADIMETTVELLDRWRSGDQVAGDRLVERYLPRLKRWAHGRLPNYARSLADTQDLVQEVLIQALSRTAGIQPRHEGALQAYLRQAIVNRIRDEYRRAQRSPARTELADAIAESSLSPLEQAIGQESAGRYLDALAKLDEEERSMIVARIELGLSYEEIAKQSGLKSASAARATIARAIARLSRYMAAP